MTKDQKRIFLEGEGDAWLERNFEALSKKDLVGDDAIIKAIRLIANEEILGSDMCVLEIGCGEGQRLAKIAQELGSDCFGIDPSRKAIEMATLKGVHANVGTADSLPYESNTFDIVIFGFCLYLCDRKDLFRIAYEADRVLKSNSWLILYDFFSENPFSRPYHHHSELRSYKMDYRRLFDWHPSYVCFSHNVTEHGKESYTDDQHEWVSLSVIRKFDR